MRTKLGVAVALSLIGTVLVTSFSASADDTEPIDSVTLEETAPSVSTDDSTTTTTTSTTTTTTTVPGPDRAPDADLIVAPAEVGTALDRPGQVVRPADRAPQQLQLSTPPAPPTTLPPLWALPPNSGEGRRIVYSKTNQWVWTVEENGVVSKHHPVSGRRTWNQPLPGTYRVFSRSAYTCNINNPSVCWRYMVRFTVGPDGDNIGFHEIPTNTTTGRPLQGEAQLGQPLSGGCVRQATPDALWIWNWAPVGTKVVVLP